MKLRVYTYKNCGTCRNAVKFLRARGLEFNEVPIRDQPPTVRELERVLGYYGGEIRKLFNTSGQDYKSMNMKERLPKLSTAEALALLAKNGNLVKRPFLLTEKSGLVGFKEADWSSLLK